MISLPPACPANGRLGFDPDVPHLAEVAGMGKCWANSLATRDRCMTAVDPHDDLGLCTGCRDRLRG